MALLDDVYYYGSMAVIDNRFHQINVELEELEKKRDALLDERANINPELLSAVDRANKDQLTPASQEFMNELEKLD